MAMTARKKAWRPKSKTGCLTCRIRHVKCDEEKPKCSRCTKTGRNCDGYDPDQAKMTGTDQPRRSSAVYSSNSSPIASPIINPNTSIISMPSPSIEGDEIERKSFRFFLDRTAPELSGFFEYKFWNSLVLQRSHSDSPIRHAVIALGALHASFKFGDVKLLEAGFIDEPRQRFALIQNNKAIRHLRGHLSHGGNPQSPEVILISCLLFICFEMMQGNYQVALTHLNSGLKILSDWIRKNELLVSNIKSHVIRSELHPLFGALDIQTKTTLSTGSTQWGMTWGSSFVDFRTQNGVPEAILSLVEAKGYLQDQTHSILEYHRRATQQKSQHDLHTDSMNAIIEEKRVQEFQLEQWSRVFDTYAQTTGPQMNRSDLRASISLKLHHVTNKLILETALFESEMDYDRYIEQFVVITSLAESLLKSYGDPNSIAGNGRVFSFDTAIIPPLLHVVCKCRDPSIRRKALALLASSFRREGGWDADYAGSIGRWMIEREEMGLENISSVGEVLEECRVVVVGIMALGRRSALVRFKQGRQNGELREEWIVW